MAAKQYRVVGSVFDSAKSQRFYDGEIVTLDIEKHGSNLVPVDPEPAPAAAPAKPEGKAKKAAATKDADDLVGA